MKMAMSGLTLTCLPTISTAMVLAAGVAGGEKEENDKMKKEIEKGRGSHALKLILFTMNSN